jgi:hypothetical protein
MACGTEMADSALKLEDWAMLGRMQGGNGGGLPCAGAETMRGSVCE